MTRYADVEKTEVLTSDEHRRIAKGLRKLGKRSVKDLTPEERKRLLASSE